VSVGKKGLLGKRRDRGTMTMPRKGRDRNQRQFDIEFREEQKTKKER